MKYEYIDRNGTPFCKHIEDHTSGSGMDYKYEWSVKGSILRLKTFYQNMNGHGYYTGSSPVCIWFDALMPKEFTIRVNRDLRESLEDLFYNAVNS